MKFDKVIVAVDGSTLSETAVDLALHSAALFSAHLTFVNVVDNADHGEFDKTYVMTRVFALKAEGEAILKKVANTATAAGADFDTKLIEGIPWMVLSDLTKECDMMIISITGSASFGTGKIGATACKVIENASCPVLTLKSGSHRIEKVLLPANSENLPAIDLAIETVKRVEGKLTVLCIESKDVDANALVNSIGERCKEAGIEYETKVASGNPAQVISAQSGMHDLVVMGTEGRTGLRKALKGSTAEKVMLNSSCPVTIVRNA